MNNRNAELYTITIPSTTTDFFTGGNQALLPKLSHCFWQRGSISMVVLFDVFIFWFFFVLFFDVAFDALFNRKLLRSTFLSKKKSSNNKCCASIE